MILEEGRISAFVFLILAYVLFYYFVSRAKAGKLPRVRTLPAVEAMEEAVGRAAEMGRPISYTPGLSGSIASSQGPQLLANISILGYVAEMCAERGVPIIYTCCIADCLPLVEETLRTSYMRMGKLDDLKLEYTMRYQPGQATMCNNILGSFQRERPAAFFMLGGLYYESVVIGEGANTIGAFSIGGTANTHQLPFIVATCDYTLLGEELFAASTALSEDKTVLGTLEGEDYFKFILLALIILGLILEPLMGKTISWLLTR